MPENGQFSFCAPETKLQAKFVPVEEKNYIAEMKESHRLVLHLSVKYKLN